MNNDLERASIYKYAIVFLLIVATLISMCLRVLYGWDHDESYLIWLSYRISQGDKLLWDLMDLHQTSAIFPALFCKIYLSVTGSVEGLGIYLRCISVVVQLVVSFYSFIVINKRKNSTSALFIAFIVANMLPRATQQLEYGTIAVWSSIVANLLIIDFYDSDRCNYTKVAVSAIFYSIAVLAYPTMVITLPGYYLFFLKSNKKYRAKVFALFVVVCMAMAALFFSYVLHFIKMDELIFSAKAMLNSGDHNSVFSMNFITEFAIKSLPRIVFTILLAYVITIVVNGIWGKRLEVLHSYIIITTLAVVLLNLTGIRPSGPYGFLERFIGMVVLALPLFKKIDDRAIFYLFYVLGILYFIGSVIGSNLGMNENAMFLELSVIASVIALSRISETCAKEYRLSVIPILVFLLGLAFSSGYFVRVNYTEPANVSQCDVKIMDGPLKYIRVRSDYEENVLSKTNFVSSVSTNDKVYAILTNDPIYNFYITGKLSAAGYAPTSSRNYNDLWINYYMIMQHDLPDVIFVDAYWYPQIDMFYSTKFGQWLKNQYTVISGNEEEFWVLNKND